MIVRCGRCRAELEVAGVGEFACPACGTRNAVRAPDPLAAADPLAPAADRFGLPDLGARTPAPAEEPVELRWIRCGECRRRFVVGEGVEQVDCPACGLSITVSTAERT